MDSVKTLKKGEALFKEGQTTDHVYIVKSGRISLLVERSGKKIEIEQVAAKQILGEQAVLGNARQTFTAEATATTQLLEVPIQLIKSQFEAAGPGAKLLMNSMGEGLKKTRQAIRSMKMEQDDSPCPQLFIPRLFAIITLVADHSGKKLENGDIVVSWMTLKIYTSRMFLESHQRMQTCIELLKKLGYASMKFEKSEDDEEVEELTEVTFHNISMIEQFGEFYQYNLYKGGKSEAIYVDTLALQVAHALNQCAQDVEADRRGAVTLDYDALLKKVKDDFKFELKATHLDAIERKGLFVKRQTRDDGVFLMFDKAEFQSMTVFWRIILEIDKWNEVGHIKSYEEEGVSDDGMENVCPDCRAEISDEHKFCPNCGHKLAA